MHRVDAPGATAGNLFTEGNPALGIAATEVSDDWLNDVQEEIVTVIEDRGITLVKGQQDQLLQAINLLIGAGGSGQIAPTIANAQTDEDVVGLIFDKTAVKCAVSLADITRRTDTNNTQTFALVVCMYDADDDIWRVSTYELFDESGVTFSMVNSTGQVQYSSDNLAGANYAGSMRITQTIKIAI